jgi:hypothetical protein
MGGGEGVKKCQNLRDVIYERPLSLAIYIEPCHFWTKYTDPLKKYQ